MIMQRKVLKSDAIDGYAVFYEMQLPQFSESESYGKHLSSVRWQIATVAIICKVFATNLWK